MRKFRICILMGIFLTLYLGLFARLAYYQVIKGYTVSKEAVAMRSKEIGLGEFTRGKILDRNLLPLTGTDSCSAVYCLPQEINGDTIPKGDNSDSNSGSRKFAEIADFLAGIISDDEAFDETLTPIVHEDINSPPGALGDQISAIEKANRRALLRDQILAKLNNGVEAECPLIRIKSDLTPQEVAKIESANLPGLVIAPVIKRYREDGFCVHFLGYISGNATATEGKAGIEMFYDNLLRAGLPAQELASVFDARGMAIKGLMFKLKQEEENQQSAVILTIDKRIQESVEAIMSAHIAKGAIVVMDINSKEILAIASRPTFNPYRVENVLEDEESVLENRALGRYHPGSLFKILVAAAAIEEGVISLDDHFNCTGEYKFNEEVSIPCWHQAGHGELDLRQAFALSCNPAFIDVCLQLGRTRLLEYVDRFHITDEQIIGYKHNSGSYVTVDSSEPALGNACLGQQGIMLTPLQLTSLIATIADNGNWAPPAAVKYTIDKNGQRDILLKPAKERVISLETAKRVQELMSLVISSGTGMTAATPEVKTAGKTATSQTGNVKDDKEVLNAWFGGFFPAENPKWAIVVLVEDGKTGAEDATPVFREIVSNILLYYSIAN